MEKVCISVGEMGKRLGISRCIAYQLVKREDFPKILIGKRILVPLAGLDKWLEEQATATKGE